MNERQECITLSSISNFFAFNEKTFFLRSERRNEIKKWKKILFVAKRRKSFHLPTSTMPNDSKTFFPLVQNETSEFISQFLFFFDFNSSLCEFLCCFLQDFLLSKSIDGVTESILRPLKLQAAP